MATKQLVTKVWIAPGCIVCDACETASPEVFEVQEATCIIRPEALDAEFLKPRSLTVAEAAAECPVEVIKFETVEVEVPDDAPVAAPTPAVATPKVAAEAVPAGAIDAAGVAAALAAGPTPAPAQAPVAAADPNVQALLRATTARGGKAGHTGNDDVPPAVKALRSRKIDDLPPDARFGKVLEAARGMAGGEKVSRRAVMTAAGVGWVAFAGASAAGGLALQRFMFPNALEEPDTRIPIGDVSKYMEMPVGQVNEDFKPQGIWIVRLEGAIAALSTTCTHLGCIPNWLDAERKFKCPCHGSGFMQTGVNFEGPAPRPLERCQISIEDGMVVVDKSKRFQQEKGEWSNPDSFISV